MEKRLISWGFVVAAVILVFVGWESYQHTVRVYKAADARKQSFEVQGVLVETVARLVDAETGQRGFLLTGDEAYLEPYRAAIKDLDQGMSQLKALTSDHPDQQKRIQALEPLIEKKLAKLQSTIDLRRKEGFEAANQAVLEGHGKEWMDQIRVILAEMIDEQNNLRRIRTQEMKQALARMTRIVVAGNVLSTLLLSTVFALLLRELSERKRAQEALAKSERWFSTTLASVGDAVIATDMNGAVTFMNSVAQSLTGWSQAEAAGKSMDLVFDIVSKETRRPVENPVKKVFREGKVVGLADHTLLLSKDGREYDIEDSAAPILADTGEGFGVVLVFRDVTEKKRAEEETRRQKELLQLILGSIADGVVVADANGKFLLFNAAAEQIVGVGATDAAPEQWSDRYGTYLPDTATPYPSNELPLVRAMRGESVDAAEVFIRNAKVPDGRLLSITGRPLRSEGGTLQGGVVLFHDITERKRAEQALRQSEERYHLLFDSNPHPAWVYGLKTLAILDVNPSAVRNYGYSREEFLSLTIKDIRPPEDIPALLESTTKASPDTEAAGVWRHRKKDGTLIDVEITSHPLVYGGRDARLVVATDITTRKKAEEALQQSEKRTRLVIETAYDSFISIDAKGLIAEWNHQAEATFGWSREEAIGKSLAELIIPVRYREAHSRGLKHFLATGEGPVLNRRIEIAALHRDGHEFPVEMTISPIRLGQTFIFNAFIHDITGRKKAEEALVRAKEEAERASKFKDQFLSTMSHELRTPLNAVLGFSDLLADERYGPLNDRQQRYVSHIHSGGKHLLRLISDILDLSKIEAGRMELAMQSLRVEMAFGEVLSVMQPLADKKAQALSNYVEPGLAVLADATRFKQVLMNLLGNAIKFTPESGRIEVAARSVDGQVRVEVRDNGPGIPPEEQKRIFEAFYRLQCGKGTEGTGLGLAITQRLVELHGGQLGLESEPGRGSCFYFSLPVAEPILPSPPRRTDSGPRASTPSRILVIEDDAAAGQLIQSQLTSAGYEVTVCKEPQHAVEIALHLQPSAITMDIMMKPANGWELLSQLKRDSRTAAIPVIVVTIVDQPSMGALLGADEYLVKPVDKMALLAAVERCARRGAAPTRPVLVVEDDTPTREFISEMLTARGYAVALAADGAEARAHVAASLPELVILDLILPKVSGFELLGEWRANSRTADLPVFVLTSKDLSQEEQSYVRRHAESLLHKQEPWQEALVKQIQRVIAQGQPERV